MDLYWMHPAADLALSGEKVTGAPETPIGTMRDFIRPGRSVGDRHIEWLNSRLRDERLNTTPFLLLDEARAKIEE